MRFTLAVALALSVATPALAAPGEPRLLQGTLEWPSMLAGEPFVVLRGDDGRLYYVEISSAQRRTAAALSAGARLALLGLEGAKPHEVTALAIGAGDTASLARAITSGAPGAAAVPVALGAAPTTTAALAPAVIAPAAAAPSPTVAPAPAAAASTLAPSATPPGQPTPTAVGATAPAPSKASAPAAPPTASVTAPPAAAAPAATAPAAPPPTSSAPGASAVPPSSPAPPSATPPPASPAAVGSRPAEPTATNAPPSSPAADPATSDTRFVVWPAPGSRWTEARGVVESVTGRTLVLRNDAGQIVVVDVSELNANLSESIKPGTIVSVYGDTLETKFRARGVMHTEATAEADSAPHPARVTSPRRPR